MKTTRRKFKSAHILLFALIWFLPAVSAQAGEPLNRLRDTINEVIAIVSNEKLKDDDEARREHLRTVIDQRFSYRQMGARTLQQNWENFSAGQKEEFIALFKQLLEKAYGHMIENYDGGAIRYLDEQVKGRFAMIQTEVKRADRTVRLDYKMVNENGDWRVFDLTVDNVSLTHNYHRQFTQVIQDESITALLDRMKKSITAS